MALRGASRRDPVRVSGDAGQSHRVFWPERRGPPTAGSIGAGRGPTHRTKSELGLSGRERKPGGQGRPQGDPGHEDGDDSARQADAKARSGFAHLTH
jgi:hypothetical protein